MTRILVTPRARNDLLECWVYIAENNIKAADRFWLEIKKKFQVLAKSPSLGRLREELGSGLRSLSIGNHVIFYRLIEEDIQIIRFLHGARNIQQLLSEK